MPFGVVLGADEDIEVDSVSVTWDGAAASATFLACLSVYSQNNVLIARVFPSQQFAVGDTGEVTYAPFLGGGGLGSSVTAVSLDQVAFDPVAGFIEVTSTNSAAPTTIITGSAIVYDGLTLVRVEVYTAAIDVDQRGIANTSSTVFELYEDGVAVGLFGAWNANEQQYISWACYATTFFTPTAGSHTYSVRAYKIPGGAGTSGPSYVYGTGVTTPHVTRSGFMLTTAYVIE